MVTMHGSWVVHVVVCTDWGSSSQLVGYVGFDLLSMLQGRVCTVHHPAHLWAAQLFPAAAFLARIVWPKGCVC